ncbi:hypothetical protein Tco_0118699, partial [Tanacetum coccineum]
ANSAHTAKGKRMTSDVGEQGIDAVKSKATGRVKSVMAWVPKRN